MKAQGCALGWRTILIAAALQAAVMISASGQIIVQLVVPGTSDPWLAGMPDGSIASCWEPQGCDTAPTHSPQQVIGLCLRAGEPLTFQATGGVLHYDGWPPHPPDGDGVTNHNWDDDYGENGIADVQAPYDCLLGVFLDDTQPDQSPDPPNLNFSTPESRDYLTFLPLLKQPFFIGDGLTSQGEEQHVIVPEGATRLFLGTMDSSTWVDNIGQFEVTVIEPCGPSAAGSPTWGAVKARYR